MDGDAAGLKFLETRLRGELKLIRQDSRLVTPGHRRGEALRQHVADLLDAIEHRFQAPAPSASAPPAARAAYATAVRLAIVQLQSAHRALPWLAATRTPHLNLGSLYVAEEIALDLIGSDVDLVVVPDLDYMYSTVSWPFNSYIAAVPGFNPQTKRRPIVLNFPLTDADRLLLHPIFAHELGHSSARAHRLVATVLTDILTDPAVAAARLALLKQLQKNAPGSSATLAQLSRQVDAGLAAWTEELICDALALEWAGPPYLLAFANFVMARNYGEPGPSHPPNTLRILLAMEHLRARGWGQYIDDKWPNIVGWLDSVAQDSSSQLQAIQGYYRDTLIAHAADFRDAAAARLGAQAVEAVATTEGAEKTAELLALRILPVENQGPIERRAVMLGAWQAALQIHGDSPASIASSVADDPMQELVGKALEVSVVVEEWAKL